MVDVPYPLSSAPGASPQESAGRLVNVYPEPLGDASTRKVVYRRVPGLRPWGTSGETGFRGQTEIGGTLYAAFNGKLLRWSAPGAGTVVGNLAGTERVFFARNNKALTPDQVAVTENGAFVFTTSAVNDYPDIDLPQPRDVAMQDGYFFFPLGDGRVFASDLNSTAINPLSFVTCEGKPDSLLRAIPWNSQMLFFGTNSMEVFENQATLPFPYARVTVRPVGLAGAGAIAGHQDGFGKALIFVASNNTVCQLNGYEAEKISPPDLDRLIENLPDKNVLEASVHVSGGHEFWTLSCPLWTWEYDLNNTKWHERQSWQQSRWRGSQPVLVSNKWLAGDILTGNINEITAQVQKEVTSPLRAIIESGPVQKFPNRIQVARADFQFVAGVGIATGADPIETDPQVEISWSDDGGNKWSVPLFRKLGRQGKANKRVTVMNTGLSGPQGRRWRIAMSDPCYLGFMGSNQSADARAA